METKILSSRNSSQAEIKLCKNNFEKIDPANIERDNLSRSYYPYNTNIDQKNLPKFKRFEIKWLVDNFAQKNECWSILKENDYTAEEMEMERYEKLLFSILVGVKFDTLIENFS